MILEVSRLFGGFFLSPSNTPKYFVWLDALSYVKYTYVGVALNELTGLQLSCPAGQTDCISGQSVIDKLGLDSLTMSGCAGALILMIVAFRLIAYLGIRFIKW